MSDEIIGSIFNHWNSSGLNKSADGRTFTAKICGKDFRFMRQKARARSKMLLKAAPLAKLIGKFVSISQHSEVNSIPEKISQVVAELDSENFEELLYSLIGWAECRNENIDQYEHIKDNVYDLVFDDDLSLQVPVVTGVIQANFLDFFLKDSGG